MKINSKTTVRALLLAIGLHYLPAATAANIELYIFDDDGKLAAGNLLQDGTSFRTELMQGLLHIGKRLDSNSTFRIALHSDTVPGGSASGGQLARGYFQATVNGMQTSLQVQTALDALENATPLGACEADVKVTLDIDKLYSEFQGFQTYRNSLIRSTVLHELGHALGIAANAPTVFWSLSNEVGNFDPVRYAAGGENVIAVLGRQVRLQESWGRQPESHVGTGATYQILFDGSINEGFYNLYGEYENEDVMISVTSAGPRYNHSLHFTPVDMAIFKDIGYPIAPMNAAFFLDGDVAEIGYNLTNVNVLYLPFTQVAGTLYSLHLSWDGATTFTLLGVPNDGRPLELLTWQPAATDVLNSIPAEFDEASGMLTIPDVEVYLGEKVEHYSMSLKLVPDSFPIQFALQALTPIETAPRLEPKITLTYCQ